MTNTSPISVVGSELRVCIHPVVGCFIAEIFVGGNGISFAYGTTREAAAVGAVLSVAGRRAHHWRTHGK